MALGVFSRGSPSNMLSRYAVSPSLSYISIIVSCLTCMETNFSSIGFNKDTKSDDISLMSLKCSVVLALKRSSVSPSSGSTSFSSSWLSLGNKNHSFRRALLEIFSLLLSPYHVFFTGSLSQRSIASQRMMIYFTCFDVSLFVFLVCDRLL